MRLGFAILSHDHPEQVLLLVKTLNAVFDSPSIACHHDFSQAPLCRETFPGNVRFVVPHIKTRWGGISTSLAVRETFRLLREHGQPDWFVLLSGADYPVRPARCLLQLLSTTSFDAFLDHREIGVHRMPDVPVAEHGFDSPAYMDVALDRYYFPNFRCVLPSRELLREGRFPFRKRAFAIRNRLASNLGGRSRPGRIYAGDFWFQANRRSIDRLLHPSFQALVEFYKHRYIPDESIFHTALCAGGDLHICKQNWRYADWTASGLHPKWLDASDLARIAAAGAFFARKFRPDGMVQAAVRKELLGLSMDI